MIKTLGIALALSCIFLVSSRNLLGGKLFYTHDYVHGARIAEMARGLEQGTIPVWWSQNFGYGYGMPLFLFYGPLPYYAGAVLYLALGSLSWSVLLVLLATNVLCLVGAYLVGKAVAGRTAGVLLAALYVLAPYRAVDMFVRGALNEGVALAVFPWLILGWVGVVKRKRFSWLLISLSTAALITSHNLSALFLVPGAAVIACALWFWIASKKILTPRQFGSFLLTGFVSTILGVGLSAWYSVPALMEKSLTKVDSLVLTGYFDFHNHFLYLRQFLLDRWDYGGSTWGPNDDISFFLGYGLILALVAGGVLFLFRLKSEKQKKHHLISFLLLGLLAATTILLTTQKTLWLWETVGPLQYLQFPWRLLGLICFVLALTATLLLSRMKKIRSIAVAVILMVTLVTSWRYFQPKEFLADSSGYYYSDTQRIQSQMSDILPDYIPQSMVLPIAPSTQPFLNQVDDAPEVLKESAAEKLYRVHAKESTLIELAIADFPGWHASIDGFSVPLGPSDSGLITLTVPEGTHLLSLRFGYTTARSWGMGISLIALVILGSVLYIQSYGSSNYQRNSHH